MESIVKESSDKSLDLKPETTQSISYFGAVSGFFDESKQVRILRKKMRLENISEPYFETLKQLASLKHSNLLEIYEIQRISEREYEIFFEDNAVADLADDTTQRFEKGNKISGVEILEILKQVASALRYLHLENTVHGEITRKTIIRSKSGQYKLLHPVATNKNMDAAKLVLSTYKNIAEELSSLQHQKQLIAPHPFKQDITNLGAALLEVYFYPKAVSLPVKNPRDLLKGKYASAILEIILKMIDDKENGIPDNLALEKAINNKTLQELVEKDDIEQRNKFDLSSSRSLSISSAGNALRERYSQANQGQEIMNNQQISSSFICQPMLIINQDITQEDPAKSTPERRSRSMFEYNFVQFNNGDTDEVFCSPKVLPSEKGTDTFVANVIERTSKSQQLFSSDIKEQSLNRKFNDTNFLESSQKQLHSRPEISHISDAMSIYRSYASPQNQTPLGLKHFTFPDGPEKRIESGRTLQYRNQKEARGYDKPQKHDLLEAEKSTAFNSSQKEIQSQPGTEIRVSEDLNRNTGEAGRNFPDYFNTPQKRDYPSLVSRDFTNVKTDGSQVRQTADNTHRTTNLTSPRDASRYIMFTPRKPDQKASLSNTNQFLFEAFSPLKDSTQSRIKTRRDDLTVNPLSQVLKRSIGSFSNKESREKYTPISSKYSNKIIFNRDDMKELIEEFVNEGSITRNLGTFSQTKFLPELNYFEVSGIDETRYEGEMLNHKRHGRGKLRFKNGNYYEGLWKNDLMDGYGILFDKDKNKIYEGHYTKGMMEGSGVLYNRNKSLSKEVSLPKNFDKGSDKWIKYEGMFRENEWEGIGKIYFSNGEMYYGEFQKSKIHGSGCLYTNSVHVINQIWENNCLIVSAELNGDDITFE